MRHYFTNVLFAALMGLIVLSPAVGQWQQPIPGAGRAPAGWEGLQGTYINQDTGGFCYIYRLPGGGFLFVDDAAQRVNFVVTGRGQLQSVQSRDGMRIAVNVGRDELGRIVLYFVGPGQVSGTWISAS